MKPRPILILPAEREVLHACLDVCQIHPKIAWAYRMNVGGFRNEHGQFVKFGFKGCSDIIGQITDGRFFAWEVKRPGKKPTADQRAFLEVVAWTGGVAGWCDDGMVLMQCLDSLGSVDSPKLGIIDGVIPTQH